MNFKSITTASLALILVATASSAVAQNTIRTAPAASTASAEDSASKNPNFITDDNFMFYCEISQESVKTLTLGLEKWSKSNPNHPLKMMLNSPGGDVLASFALIDELNHLRSSGHKLTIVVYGMAASAAGYVLQAADQRIIGANSTILIHEISSNTGGKLSQMTESIALDSRLENQFLQLLVNRSHLTIKEIHSHIDGHDWWLTANEALKAGLVDLIEGVPAAQK